MLSLSRDGSGAEERVEDRECVVFTGHLLGVAPDAYVKRKYAEAHDVLGGLAPTDPFDAFLLRFASKHRVCTRLADAYARVFRPGSALRRKLIVLLAILETSPPSYRRSTLPWADPKRCCCFGWPSGDPSGFSACWSALCCWSRPGWRSQSPVAERTSTMSGTVTVVGSGASGVHFALSLLRKGVSVTMLDVGRQGAPPVSPESSLTGLKDTLADPALISSGHGYEGVLLPDADGEYYGIPPSKQYVFDQPAGFGHASTGFAPLFSFARGGLAEAWTGGCYPLNADEIADFPVFSYATSRLTTTRWRAGSASPAPTTIWRRFLPVHDHLLPPLALDRHSEKLLQAYERARDRLNRGGRVHRPDAGRHAQPSARLARGLRLPGALPVGLPAQRVVHAVTNPAGMPDALGVHVRPWRCGGPFHDRARQPRAFRRRSSG